MSQSGLATLFGLRGDDPNSLKVPPAPHVDTTDAQAAAIAGNIQNLPELLKLAASADAGTLASLERMLPGYGALLKKGTENLMSQLSGQLPPDVERYIQQQSAQRGVSRGTSGSQFDQYGTLRDLGLTSLQLADRALDSAARWMQSTTARSFDFSQMFVSPGQRIATEQWNEVNRYNAQFLRNQIKMLPSNAEMAGAQILDYVSTWATMASSMGTSSMMGGGGQQGGQQMGGGQPYSTGAMNQYYQNYGPGY